MAAIRSHGNQATALRLVNEAHAQDMATWQYFDHRDHRGRLPMERTQEIGYHGSVIGENMLDARFTEMGIAFAAGHGEQRPALYWVQELGLPQP